VDEPVVAADDTDEQVLPPGTPTDQDADVEPHLFPEEEGAYGEFEPERPPLVGPDGRVRLSFSRVDTFEGCSQAFRYAYVDRLPGKPAPNLSFGSSVHGALEAFYDRKLPDPPTEEELLAMLYDAWDSSGFEGLDRDEQLRHYRHAQRVLQAFHRRAAPRYHLPVATEAWFEMAVGDHAIVVGSIDRVDLRDDELHVVDYKTNKRAKPRQHVAGSLQLAIYALACEHLYGRLPRSVALDFVVPGLEVSVDIDEIDLDDARQRIDAVALAILEGAYSPTPGWLCDWCDYKPLCPAWPDGEPEEALGTLERDAARLRRSVARSVEELRALESGLERVRGELADAPQPRLPDASDGDG
jgi:RecB family exonuclease